jgi:outer membrane protein assembly factor BamB
MEQLGADECVMCYSIDDGKLLWRYSYPQRHEDLPGMGKAGPRATPTVHQGKVYAQGAAGMLSCLDGSTGKLLWKHDLCDLLKIERLERKDSDGFTYLEEKSPLAWGRSGSPLVVGQLVYVPGGGPNGGPFSTLLAFDKDSGDMAWKSGDDMIAYGSPSYAIVAGVPQIMLVAEKSAMGFDPTSGEVLWSYSRPGASNAMANCSQVTVASDNHVLLTKGYGLGGELLALEDNGQGISVDSLWKSSRVLTTKFSNPVILDGYVYALADGFLECVNLKDGKMTWELRERFGHGQLLLVGDMLLVHSESGRLRLYPAKPEKPSVLGARPTIKGICWNTLCLYGDRLIVRSDLEMACIRLPVLSLNENSK